ncbi:MAG TPA: CRTAC1 family protein, partial [Acidobacteriota bacterium]|nr:CRTAC1 family protein [Acidobacteriota bacterium]
DAIFKEITKDTGLTFRHQVALEDDYFMPQIIGSGGALFDYDGDGDLDLYLVNAGGFRHKLPEAVNQLFQRKPDGSFSRVADPGALNQGGFGMGCAVGDIDNDGHPDLLVTNYGPNRLYRNRGDGSFEDVTEGAAIAGDDWSTSAAFFDYDRDGYLDLYIANYLLYDPTRKCHDQAGRREFCGPEAFLGVGDRLYRNQGDATFKDVTSSAGIGRVAGKGLGVMASDLNDDGWIDVYVANDGEANQLWINQGDGTFLDEALLRGVALNMFGRPEASMGVAVGDIDMDGDFDLFMTHLDRESNTFYLNLGQGEFEDRTAGSGLATPSLPFTGFGTIFLDFDQDADLDLFLVNGRVRLGSAVSRTPRPDGHIGPIWDDYAEPNLLFENQAGTFQDVSSRAGRLTSLREVSRSVMAGDLDDDGDLDLVVTNANGPARIFQNRHPGSGRWLQVRVLDPALKRDAIGAKVTVEMQGARLTREVTRSAGYLSSNPPVLHFGLGSAESFQSIQVRWPDGSRERFPGGRANRRIILNKAEGES